MTVTETSPQVDPNVAQAILSLRQISEQVKAIDNELGTDDGGVVAKRNKIANEYVLKFNTPNLQAVLNEDGSPKLKADGTPEQEDLNPFTKFTTQIVSAIKSRFSKDDQGNADPVLQAAVYTEIHNQLGKEFGKVVKEHLDAEVAKLPKVEVPTISDERKTELALNRSKLVNIFKLQKEMLKYYEEELPSDIEEPSARKGAIGPRGDKITRQYQFFVGEPGKEETMKHRTVKLDGKRSEINLSQIASTVAKDGFTNTKALKDYIIKELGVTPADGKVDLGERWEVTLPAPVNKVLRGVAINSSQAVVDEADDGEDDDDDDTNGSTEAASTEDDMFSSMEQQA